MGGGDCRNVICRPVVGIGMIEHMKTLACALATLLLSTTLTAAEGFLGDPVAALVKGTVNKCEASLVDAQGREGKALRLRVATLPEAGWMAHAYVYGLEQDLHVGDTVEVSCWTRLIDGTEGAIKVDLSQGERPYAPIVSGFITPVAEWRQHKLKGTVSSDVTGAKTRFGLCVGYRQQTVEVTRIEVRKVAAP